MPQPTLRLGIAMAGAVSAGAYTAGVIDYLIQTLQKWEEAKREGNPVVPGHQILIDVLGGTSAGGISAGLTALAFYQGLEPIEHKEHESTRFNLLYDAWVNLVDDPHRDNSFEKMLETDDITKEGGVPSLLNSSFIDEISEKSLRTFQMGTVPGFVSPDFEVLLTLSNLRGIPVEISFNSDQEHRKNSPSHSMSYHKMFAHFRTNMTEDMGDACFRLDMTKEADRRRLIEYAKATSAFPIGLKARKIEGLSSDFVLGSIRKFMPSRLLEDGLIKLPENLPEKYPFTAVDGGAFNNEPFAQITNLLKGRCKEPEHSSQDIAVVMIDPFPSFLEKSYQDYDHPGSLFGVAGGIIGALRNQSSFKDADLLTVEVEEYKRNMIYPVRYENGKKVEGNAIACGALDGFSGFLKKDFRRHDFFLGRDNCKNFLRYIFTIQYPKKDGKFDPSNFHPIHRDWTEEMIRQFGSDQKNALFLPVIPDMSRLETTREEEWRSFKLHQMEFPNIHPDKIVDLKEKIMERADKMIEAMLNGKENASETESDDNRIKVIVNQYMQQHFPPSGFLARKMAGFIQPRITKKAVDAVAEKVIGAILTDLAKKGLVDLDDF